MELNFDTIYDIAAKKADEMGGEYKERLEVERTQIRKQGAEEYWINLILSRKSFKTNKNGLVLPFLLNITTIDPIASSIKHNFKRDPDMPDIDLDFLPAARNKIKQYSIDRFGEDKVCTVGSWTTYNPKSAHQDVARAKGRDLDEVMKLTAALPVDFDNMNDPLEAVEEFDEYKEYYQHNKDICEAAFKLKGKIKTQGRHAGGIIISRVPLWDHLPMAKLGDQWTSEWTEGNNIELSKFGFVKYDALGLKTMEYIWLAEQYIKKNKNIVINWDEIGYDDEASLGLANQLKTDSIFQFDTDSMKSIIAKGGVKSFNDLLVYNAMGRPGPMPMIDEYVRRRDDPNNEWAQDEHPRMVELFKDTYGICVYQESLTEYWTEICGFTMPQAEKARKAIAKKWKDEIPGIMKRAFEGGKKILGEEASRVWTERTKSFGRYAFNKSHAVAYCIQSYRCLYLKAHYPVEWWCAVLNACVDDRKPRYMGIARREGVKFGSIDARHLSGDFAVLGDSIIPGLQGIKGIGPSIINKLDLGVHEYDSIDDFIKHNIKSKTLLERLIKLGAFDQIHPNRKATWYWYQFKYASGKDITDLKNRIKAKFEWTEDQIQEEIDRRTKEYFKLYPNRKVLPAKIKNWKPKIKLSRDQVMGIIKSDFSLHDRLEFQKEYLGYYWDSPMDLFKHDGHTIQEAKDSRMLECVIEKIEHRKTKRGSEFITLHVTDGLDKAKIQVWSDMIEKYGEYFSDGAGLYVVVDWNEQFSSFNLAKHSEIYKLRPQNNETIDQ